MGRKFIGPGHPGQSQILGRTLSDPCITKSEGVFMKLGVNKLSTAVRMGLSLGAVIAVGASTSAFAQDSGTQNNQSNNSDQSKTKTLKTVTVTGSLIRRVDLETSNPVVTIDRARSRKPAR